MEHEIKESPEILCLEEKLKRLNTRIMNIGFVDTEKAIKLVDRFFAQTDSFLVQQLSELET